MMLSLDTAYRSFGGEVEASSTPTICRLSDSRRHQLWAIARARYEVNPDNTWNQAWRDGKNESGGCGDETVNDKQNAQSLMIHAGKLPGKRAQIAAWFVVI